MTEFVAVRWITGRDNIGVVLIKNVDTPIPNYKAYIGVVSGKDEVADREHIYRYGTKLAVQEALGFFRSDIRLDCELNDYCEIEYNGTPLVIDAV